MMQPVGNPPIAVILFVSVLIAYTVKSDSNLLVNRNGLNSAEGVKHVDVFDKEDDALHGSKSLDNKGKDKSTTVTQAQLTATLKAKDKHEDSYSHLHDNAHETDFGADHDVLLGDEAVAGHEIDDEGVDYIEPVEYDQEYLHEDHTVGHDGLHADGFEDYGAPDYAGGDVHPGHVLHSPMVHAGVHGSVHPTVHGHHVPIGHHQTLVDGGFVPSLHHHDVQYVPDHHGFIPGPDHNLAHAGGIPHAVHHPHGVRRRYFVRPAQANFPAHTDFSDQNVPWVAGGGFH